MKLTFEVHGYNITIEETEDGIVVSAMQGDEEVDSFTLDMGGEDIDTDIDMDENPDMDDESQVDDMGEEGAQELPGDEFTGDDGENKLESFMAFIKKRK